MPEQSLGQLTAYLGADIRQMRQSMDRAERMLHEYERTTDRRLDKAEARWKTYGRRVQGYASNMRSSIMSLQGALVGLGGVLVIRKTLTSFSELEQGLIEVQKTTGMADAEIAQLKEQVHKIGQEVPVATTRLLEIAGAAGQLGVKGVKNVRLFTETLAKMEVASDVVGAEGAKALARLLNTAGESMNKVDQLGSVIVALGNNAAASESEIIKMASEIGRATAAFEVSSDQAVAYGAALKSMGARAELSGSAIGRMMIMIEKASISGGKQLQKLANMAGMTANEFTSAFEKDAAGALNALLRGMNRMVTKEGRKAVGLLDDLGLKGMEVVKGITPLISNIEELDNAFNIANDEMEDSNALTREAFEASKSFSSQMQMTWNAVDKVASEIGKALAPAIVDMTKDFRDWVSENDKFIKQDIPNEIENMADRVLDLKDSMSDLVNSSEFQTFMDNWEMIAGAAIGYRLGGWKGAITMAAGADIFSRAKDIASETGQDATDPKVLAQVLGFTDSAASHSGRWQIDPRAEHPDADRLRRFRREQEKNQKLLDLHRNPDYGLDDLNSDKNGNGGGGESEKERLARIKAHEEEMDRLLDITRYRISRENKLEKEAAEERKSIREEFSDKYEAITTDRFEREREQVRKNVERFKQAQIDEVKIAEYRAARMAEINEEEREANMPQSQGDPTSWENVKNMGFIEQLQTGASAGFEQIERDAMNFAEASKTVVVGAFEEMSDALTDFIMKGKADWRDFTTSILSMISKILIRSAMVQAASAVAGAADGAVMQGGRMTGFAQGGVVSQPTIFPMANGTGLMGEEGPEAIMPLSRTSSGELGVKIDERGDKDKKSKKVEQHFHINVQTGPDGKIAQESMQQMQRRLARTTKQAQMKEQ